MATLTGSRKKTAFGVIALLLVLLAELSSTVHRQSLSWDEGDHIFAGYISLKHSDYGLNPEHPPLVKMLATLPLMNLKLYVPPIQNRYFKTEAFFDGRDMIFNSGPENSADKIIFRVRMAAATLTLLLGLIVFAAGREMFGTAAGLLALTLLVFEPNIIAHGAYVTTDIGSTCFVFATIFAFYRYWKHPGLFRLVLVGLAAGLALASKHSTILLFPMLFLLSIYELWSKAGANHAEPFQRKALRAVQAFATITVISLIVLWAFYGFRYAARPDGLQINPPLAAILHDLKPHDAMLLGLAAQLHLLPESYIYGLADVRSVADFMPSYIFGKVYAHGVWFYFPVAFLIKSTLAFLAFVGLIGFALLSKKLRWSREVVYLTIPPAFYFLIAIVTTLNIGIRHVIMVYVYLSILAAGTAIQLVRTNRKWLYVTAALVAFHIFASVRAYPLYIPYANELWGGSSATAKYLTDSNTDWAQQLKSVKQYLDKRGTKECWFAYFAAPAIRPSSYGIPCKLLPTADTMWFGEQLDVPTTIEGPVLISAGSLTGFELGSNVLNPYAQIQKMTPTTVIDHGVYVFDGTFQIPRAAAMCRTQRASTLLGERKLDDALSMVQSALNVDPEYFSALMTMGDIYSEEKQPEKAAEAYRHALAVAKTMEPSAQKSWIPRIEKKLHQQ